MVTVVRGGRTHATRIRRVREQASKTVSQEPVPHAAGDRKIDGVERASFGGR